MEIILTKTEANLLLNAKEGEISISVDLGMSKTKATKKAHQITIKHETVTIDELKRVKENFCYALQKGKILQVALFSPETNFYYKLLPTTDWPTITLSSTPMHRHSKLSPKKDTELKIKEISPVQGRILDTCCGLGYTTIMAARGAQQVDVFERDPNVLVIASYNPYSLELFHNKKIALHEEFVDEGIATFPSETFDRIVHDPPTFKYAPELYSKAFHLQLFRVMKQHGILYHYCPTPQKMKGRLLYPKMVRQLKEAGFYDVEYHEESSGIRAVKG
ncbi:RsmD family RNA methyltransferase [Candidatus Woesearchaeota archaeon]|nr:RsmD family RNA methyltransferase [Candidatus Woesearchaeota archaeon]